MRHLKAVDDEATIMFRRSSVATSDKIQGAIKKEFMDYLEVISAIFYFEGRDDMAPEGFCLLPMYLL